MAIVPSSPGRRPAPLPRHAAGCASALAAAPSLPAAAGWPPLARLLLRLAVGLANRAEARRRRPADLTRLSAHLRRDVGLER